MVSHSALQLFLGYRVFVATAIVVLFFVIRKDPLGSHDSTLFSAVSLLYSFLVIAALMFGLARPRRPGLQATSAVLVDILMLSILMYASGGVPSGIGILIALSIALVANIVAKRMALALAAIASLAAIGEELLAQWIGAFGKTAYVQAGLLGIAYFALVLLWLPSSRHAHDAVNNWPSSAKMS